MSCVVYLREDASNVCRKLCTGERVRMNCLETLNRKKCRIMANLITEFKCSQSVVVLPGTAFSECAGVDDRKVYMPVKNSPEKIEGLTIKEKEER